MSYLADISLSRVCLLRVEDIASASNLKNLQRLPLSVGKWCDENNSAQRIKLFCEVLQTRVKHNFPQLSSE